MKPWKTLLSLGIACALLLAVHGLSQGYEKYNTNSRDGSNNCAFCHSSFIERGAAHDMHADNSEMDIPCTLCHTSIGDNPFLASSGTDPSNGCTGCHSGPGLRLHHMAANAPADPSGFTCIDVCHSAETPLGENFLRPFYTRGDIAISDPCVVASASGGEDYDGDGEGLDNDGDLLYEGDDENCNGVPVELRAWGTVKADFR